MVRTRSPNRSAQTQRRISPGTIALWAVVIGEAIAIALAVWSMAGGTGSR